MKLRCFDISSSLDALVLRTTENFFHSIHFSLYTGHRWSPCTCFIASKPPAPTFIARREQSARCVPLILFWLGHFQMFTAKEIMFSSIIV